jgi:hypothetical protein
MNLFEDTDIDIIILSMLGQISKEFDCSWSGMCIYFETEGVYLCGG